MKDSTKILMLREYALFDSLNDSEISHLAMSSLLKRVRKNDFVFHKDEGIKNVYLVEKGKIKSGMETRHGKILIKHIIYDKDIFGENVFSSSHRNEFAQAMIDSTVIVIPVHTFRTIISRNVEFASKIMEIIVTRLNEVENRLHNFVFKKAKDRILDFIIKTGKLRGIRIGLDECLINHGMSHKEIAYLTDTSRQTVARVLGELKRENIIHFSPRKPGKILIRALV